MLRSFSWGPVAASAVLISTGLTLLVGPRAALPAAFLLLASLACIQLLQGGIKPYLGSAAVILAACLRLSLLFLPFPETLYRFGFSPLALQLLLTVLFFLPLVMLGISMNRAGTFPSRWGTTFALVPFLGLIIGVNLALAIAFVVLGIFSFTRLRLGSSGKGGPGPSQPGSELPA
jgi:hypothetical protein